ncbi:MAG: hypothetical protein ACREHG_09105 [Candidatus Saccharimonadales bacterium]
MGSVEEKLLAGASSGEREAQAKVSLLIFAEHHRKERSDESFSGKGFGRYPARAHHLTFSFNSLQ